MFMVEEDGKRLLLTGDGQQDFILAGLERTGFLDDGIISTWTCSKCSTTAQNITWTTTSPARSRPITTSFAATASTRIRICVIDILFNSRLGDARPIPFLVQHDLRLTERRHEETRNISPSWEEHVDELKGDSGGRLKLHFIQLAFIELNLDD